jgi:hypothetical protein
MSHHRRLPRSVVFLLLVLWAAVCSGQPALAPDTAIIGGMFSPGESSSPADTVEGVGYATVVIAGVPAGGKLFIDGTEKGRTPCRLDSIVPGIYEVRIETAGYQLFRKMFDIRAGARKKVTVRLVPQKPSVTILSEPPGALVTVDGTRVGTTPFTTAALEAGEHALRLSLADYDPLEGTIRVPADGPDTLRYRLVAVAGGDSVREGGGRKLRVLSRITLGTVAAGFWALGMWQNGRLGDAVADENAAYERYASPRRTQSDYDRAWRSYTEAADRADTAAKRRNVLYTIAGICSIGFGLTFVF